VSVLNLDDVRAISHIWSIKGHNLGLGAMVGGHTALTSENYGPLFLVTIWSPPPDAHEQVTISNCEQCEIDDKPVTCMKKLYLCNIML